MKPLLILFEGVDKSGKTTLLAEFNKLTNFKHWALDRSFISSLVYNELFGRNDKEHYLNIQEIVKNSFNVVIVYVESDVELIKERLELHNELLPKELSNITKVKNTYLNYITNSKINYIRINTTNKSIQDCVDTIITKLSKFKKEEL